MSTTESPRGQCLFHRDLPGGGYVAIEVFASTTTRGRAAYRGEVVVERRASVERRGTHTPPVVAHVTASEPHEVLDALFPVAVSNAQVARRLLEWRAD